GAATAGSDEEALDREPLLRALAATLGDPVRLGHPAAAKDELGVEIDVRVVQEARRARELETRRVRLDDEQGLLPVRDREHDVEARAALARDEPLLAVDQPIVAVANGGRLDAGDVRAGTGLRDRPPLAILAAEDRRDPALHLPGCGDLEQLARATVDDRAADAVPRLARVLLQRDPAQHPQPSR